MRFSGEGELLRIYVGESDRYQGRPLYQAIVEVARQRGLAGATVIRGIEGFGASSHLHTSRILRLSEDLPMVVEIADSQDRIRGFLPVVDEMVGDGLMTVERVEVVTYRGSKASSDDVVADRLRLLREEVASLDRNDDALVTLERSIRAAHEYGASIGQIAEATDLGEAELSSLLARPAP
jgi:PII-like signaling protein